MIVELKPETEAAIRARAHQIWEEEGRPNGRQDIHWQRAYDAIVDVSSIAPTAKSAAPQVDNASSIEPTKQVAPNKPARAKAPAKKK